MSGSRVDVDLGAALSVPGGQLCAAVAAVVDHVLAEVEQVPEAAAARQTAGDQGEDAMGELSQRFISSRGARPVQPRHSTHWVMLPVL